MTILCLFLRFNNSLNDTEQARQPDEGISSRVNDDCKDNQ
jgi:hypothetical protein